MKLEASFMDQGGPGHAALETGGRAAAAPFALSRPLRPATAQTRSLEPFTVVGSGGSSPGKTTPSDPANSLPETSAPLGPGETSCLAGVFWSLVAVQTPGAPPLAIRPTSTRTVAILWPSPSNGFILQQSSDLNPAHWVPAPQPVTDNGANKFIIVHPLFESRFYRLFKP